MNKKTRIASMDLVRIFVCVCVSVVHFNASVSAWWNGIFVYPNSIVPNYYIDGRIYLGSIGVSLFFMLSGASLMLTYRSGDIRRFYKKRFLAIYPMFWITYLIVSAVDFLYWKGMSIADIKLLIYSVLGMDGYLGTLGIIPFDFVKVGEWFVGCLILLLLIFPLLHWCVEKRPLATLLIALIGYAGYMLGIRFWGFSYNEILFFLRIPELIMGMLFIKFDLRHKPKLLFGVTGVAAWLAVILRRQISGLTLCVAVCALLFALLVWLGEKIRSEAVKSALAKAAGLTYPIFLIHHWLINRLVIGFDLANMPKRNVVAMFLIYVVLTVLLAKLLQLLSGKVDRGIREWADRIRNRTEA